MPRATNSPASRKRRKRILLRAKGFRGFRSKLFRYAKDAVYKARQYEYRDRKKRKGQFRRLWIQRISAAVRNDGMTYSRFIEGLKAANIDVGGVEYLETPDGRLVFYDVNANSNLRPSVAAHFDVKPFERVVDFLERRIAAS